jgi:hypothetical protein
MGNGFKIASFFTSNGSEVTQLVYKKQLAYHCYEVFFPKIKSDAGK